MHHGTAGISGIDSENMVVSALQLGFRTLDTALLYGIQEEVGRGIKKSGVRREDISITSKCAYFPPDSEGKIWPYSADNVKGDEMASIEKSLKQLGVDYIDTMLIHTPVTSPPEFKAGFTPHFFEFGHDANQYGEQPCIEPIRTIDGDDMLELLLEARMERHKKAGIDYKQATECRAKSWENMEKALKEGKVRTIGVSNYPANLMHEMTTYASVMPAMNQIEFTISL